MGAFAVGGALLVAAPGVADEAPPTTAPDDVAAAAPFRDGPWEGTIAGRANATATVDGTTMWWIAHLDGGVTFEADAGVVAGEWWFSGPGSMVATGPLDGVMELHYDSGGTLTGDETVLQFEGTTETTGHAVFTSPTAASSAVGPVGSAIGPFEADVVALDCDRVFADWTASFEAAGEQEGWQAIDVEGTIVAQHQGMRLEADEGLRERVEEFVDDVNAWVDEVWDGVHADAETVGVGLSEAQIGDLFDLIYRAVDLEMELYWLPGDELCFLGMDVGVYSFYLTAAVQELAAWILDVDDYLTAGEYHGLADALLAVGGVGDGAVRSDVAGELEEALTRRGAQLLEEHVVADGERADGTPCTVDDPCLEATTDVLNVLQVGAALGLTFEVAGRDVTPERIDEMLTEAAQ